MFAAEAAGLQALAEAACIRTPQVLCYAASGAQAWLVCEYIAFGHEQPGSAAILGEQLAALHRHHAGGFGWFRDNTIGSTRQQNKQLSNWVDFFRSNRLGYQFTLGQQRGFASSLLQRLELLMAGMDAFFVAYTPQPSLLHGDLWSGNYAFDLDAQPVIFDPAVYYGDREADIAMTELFGGFSEECYSAYQQAWPLDCGYGVRRELYNLYHILNHANLFGGSYASQAESMIDRLLAEL